MASVTIELKLSPMEPDSRLNTSATYDTVAAISTRRSRSGPFIVSNMDSISSSNDDNASSNFPDTVFVIVS